MALIETSTAKGTVWNFSFRLEMRSSCSVQRSDDRALLASRRMFFFKRGFLIKSSEGLEERFPFFHSMRRRNTLAWNVKD